MNDLPAALPRKFPRRLLAAAGAALLVFSFSVGDAAAQSAQKKTDKSAKSAKAKKKEPPAPKEVRIWVFSRPNGVPTLVYGLANEPVITFSCQPENGLMRVVTNIGTRGVKPGDGTPVRLSNGNVRMEFSGTAFASGPANETVDIGGATKIDQKFFGLFRAGDTLLMDIPGRKRGLPVKNAAQGADAFEKACNVK